MSDSNLFAQWFKGADTWAAWRVFLGALFGLPLEDRELFVRCTGDRPLSKRQAREAYLIIGRRGGKSFVCAVIAVFLATFRRYRLSPGERGVVMLIAHDRRQARVLFRYVRAFVEGVPMIQRMVVSMRSDAVELDNGIDIEVHTCSYRAVRGYTVVAALCDEIAFGIRKTAPTPTPRSWPRYGPRWRRCRAAYCYASARPTPAVACCGARTAAITGAAGMCWCGEPTPRR
ncbi:MAG: terminase large subunit domain-containing protein [Gammaproteobacteria bacterium]